MGNREDLLTGAKDCLVRLGYARTTARDIADAAGTSLAAIAYHFDGKDNLMAAAVVEALDDAVGDSVEEALTAAPVDAGRPEQFLATFSAVLVNLPKNRIAALAGVENFAQIDQVPLVHASLRERMTRLNAHMAAAFVERNPDVSEEDATAVAKFYQTLLHGLTVCWLIDADGTPTPEEMLVAARTLSGR